MSATTTTYYLLDHLYLLCPSMFLLLFSLVNDERATRGRTDGWNNIQRGLLNNQFGTGTAHGMVVCT